MSKASEANAGVREALRLVLADGSVLLVTPEFAGRGPETLFDPTRWHRSPTPRGRGSAHFVSDGEIDGVWRAYRRGGLVARLVERSYLYLGESRVRSFAEWRLTATLFRAGLPVPRPLAARYRRLGLAYRADLLTERIPDSEMLSARLGEAGGPVPWEAIGGCLRRFHTAGVDHADLNAHNILLTAATSGFDGVHLIDFDRGRQRAPSSRSDAAERAGGAVRPAPWALANLARLRRSLDKLFPDAGFVDEGWRRLCAGYGLAES